MRVREHIAGLFTTRVQLNCIKKIQNPYPIAFWYLVRPIKLIHPRMYNTLRISPNQYNFENRDYINDIIKDIFEDAAHN